MKHYLLKDRKGEVIGKTSTLNKIPTHKRWLSLNWVKRFCVFHQIKFGLSVIHEVEFVEVNADEFVRAK